MTNLINWINEYFQSIGLGTMTNLSIMMLAIGFTVFLMLGAVVTFIEARIFIGVLRKIMK